MSLAATSRFRPDINLYSGMYEVLSIIRVQPGRDGTNPPPVYGRVRRKLNADHGCEFPLQFAIDYPPPS